MGGELNRLSSFSRGNHFLLWRKRALRLRNYILAKEKEIMSIFNEKRWLAFETGKFICAKCGKEMIFEDRWEEHLLCPYCGYRIEVEKYGFDNEEEYEAVYPILDLTEEETESADEETPKNE